MSTTREQVLQQVREAAAEGNRAGGSPALPERGTVGYQGAGVDPLARFRAELAAAGGQCRVVADLAGAVSAILDLVRAKSIGRVLLGRGEVLDQLSLASPLQAEGVEVRQVGVGEAGEEREAFFAADLGVSGVDHLIAETGSVILTTRPEQPRSLSLLPPIHVAVALRRQILPDVFDLFTVLGARSADLPACVSIITGPSKTGDIELRLVTGVHGPGEIHVIVIDSDAGLS
jgi:L-lactate utilization protein LutC